MTITAMSPNYREKYKTTPNKCECKARQFNPSMPCKHMERELDLVSNASYEDAAADLQEAAQLDEAGKTTLFWMNLQMEAIAPARTFDFDAPEVQLILHAFTRRSETENDILLKQAAEALSQKLYNKSANVIATAYRQSKKMKAGV